MAMMRLARIFQVQTNKLREVTPAAAVAAYDLRRRLPCGRMLQSPRNIFRLKFLSIALAGCCCGMAIAGGAAAANFSRDTYSFTCIAETSLPVVADCWPQEGAVNVPVDSSIWLYVQDAQSAINPESFQLTVDGTAVINKGVIQKYLRDDGQWIAYDVLLYQDSPVTYSIEYHPPHFFNYAQAVEISLSAADKYDNAVQRVYSVTTQSMVEGTPCGFIPLENIFNEPPVGAAFSAAATVLTLPEQKNARSAVSRDGRLVGLVWEQLSAAGNRDIYFTYSADYGQRFSRIVRVNDSQEPAEAAQPDVAVDSYGRFAVVWQQKSAPGAWDIYAAVFDPQQPQFSSPCRLYGDPAAARDQTSPAISASLGAAGVAITDIRFHLCWLDSAAENSFVRYGFFSAEDVAAARPIGTVLSVNDALAGQRCADPVLAEDAAGNVVVVWRTTRVADGSQSIWYDRVSGGSAGSDVLVCAAKAAPIAPAVFVSANGSRLYLGWGELSPEGRRIYF
ncbi:MAG: hypothetical protein NC924_09070, partial [Candidatus Omnitrophica bacterium]|nr:hypothetical protein [Candidatus Omnitrophota bacterium]